MPVTRANYNFLKRLHRATVLFNLAVFLSAGAVALQQSVIQVDAQPQPVTVSTHELGFGAVFPGERLVQSFTVGFDNEEVVDYQVLQKPKPLPEGHPEYPNGGDPANPGYYRDLCPFLNKVSYENEGDTEGADGSARVSLIDLTDTWQVEFAVPAVIGQIAQDHEGGFVSESGEYGCDIVIEVLGEENGFTAAAANSTLFPTNRTGSSDPVLVPGVLGIESGPFIGSANSKEREVEAGDIKVLGMEQGFLATSGFNPSELFGLLAMLCSLALIERLLKIAIIRQEKRYSVKSLAPYTFKS